MSSKEKTALEKLHRQLRAEREKDGITWTPKYFKKVEGDGLMQCNWQYSGGYWEERNDRVKVCILLSLIITYCEKKNLTPVKQTDTRIARHFFDSRQHPFFIVCPLFSSSYWRQ